MQITAHEVSMLDAVLELENFRVELLDAAGRTVGACVGDRVIRHTPPPARDDNEIERFHGFIAARFGVF